jgi:hypothetical protein
MNVKYHEMSVEDTVLNALPCHFNNEHFNMMNRFNTQRLV